MYINSQKIKEIPGLYLYPNISSTLRAKVEESFNDSSTQETLEPINYRGSKRKVIHYGFVYDYVTRNIHEETTEFPEIIKDLRNDIPDEILPNGEESSKYFNQCIINRYLPKEGISQHTDFKSFGEAIACYTFGDKREMQFTLGSKIYNVETHPGDLYVMTGDSRRKWKHSMPSHKGTGVVFSITFRNVPNAT